MSDIKGLDKLNKQLSEIKNISPKSILAGAFTLQRYSMENAPVKTGFLRESHESVETPEGAEMRVNANYSVHVEFGTSKMAAQPYVRPAIDEHGKDIVEAVSKEVQKEINSKL